MNEKKKSGGTLIVVGIALIMISAAAFIWGANYTNNFQNVATAGLSSLMGQTDSTFAMAKMAVNLSPIGFIVGLIIGIIGLVRR